MLVHPFKKTLQHTRIKLDPYLLNADVKNNMLFVLKQKVEKKCNKLGYIDEVYNITKYNDGVLLPENLSGAPIYDVEYHCKICIPVKNSNIVAQVKTINQELVICVNGPIFIFITKDKIDTTIWDPTDKFKNLKTKKPLQENDFVKIFIVDYKINQNSFQINTIGRLGDIATKDEIEKYYGKIEEDNPDDDNFI
jgi:DNA-directed RNA polymerase subunit E'/Rpb7